jgi:hypothetical protein
VDGVSEIVLISQEGYDQLIDSVVTGASPATWMSCDWIGHIPKLVIYPLRVYRVIEEARAQQKLKDEAEQNGNSDSRERNLES